jgi:hypothetical protein
MADIKFQTMRKMLLTPTLLYRTMAVKPLTHNSCPTIAGMIKFFSDYYVKTMLDFSPYNDICSFPAPDDRLSGGTWSRSCYAGLRANHP